jgi:SAM-dependent methyltransferase
MTERSFDDFDGHAENYRQIHSENVKISGADSFYFAEHKVKLLQQFEKNEKCRVLDLGCGDGATEIFMNRYFPAFRIDGIDISLKSIERAESRNIPGASFTLYDGKTIPFEDNYFDIVFVAAVLHHVDFSLHAVLIQEIHRVLKPNGRIYLFEHNPLNPVTRYLVKTCVFDKDAKLLWYSYSKKLLKEQLFRNVENKYILFFPRKGVLSGLIKLEENLGWLPFGGQYMLKAVK